MMSTFQKASCPHFCNWGHIHTTESVLRFSSRGWWWESGVTVDSQLWLARAVSVCEHEVVKVCVTIPPCVPSCPPSWGTRGGIGAWGHYSLEWWMMAEPALILVNKVEGDVTDAINFHEDAVWWTGKVMTGRGSEEKDSRRAGPSQPLVLMLEKEQLHWEDFEDKFWAWGKWSYI